MKNSTPTNAFSTSEEAVAQGKKDLLEILRVDPSLKLGVNAAQIEKAQPEQPLGIVEIDFQKLLQAGNIDSLGEIAGAGAGNTTPLSIDNQVIGLIGTRKDAEGWKVSAIGNQAIKNDLNEIRRADYKGNKLTFFEVPNLNARIYAVSIDGKENYLTNYNGFSFQKPVKIAELLPRLKQDAQEFQRLYGNIIKDQELEN